MRRLNGWTINLVPKSAEGYCWQTDKRIDLGLENENPLRLLLHEVAHIGNNTQANKHNQRWLDDYLDLMDRYMPGIPLSENDHIIIETYQLELRDVL